MLSVFHPCFISCLLAGEKEAEDAAAKAKTPDGMYVKHV